MSKKKKLVVIGCLFLLNLLMICVIQKLFTQSVNISIASASMTNEEVQIYYSANLNFSEGNSYLQKGIPANLKNTLNFQAPMNNQYIRLDFGSTASEVIVDSFTASKFYGKVDLLELARQSTELHNIQIVDNGASVTFVTTGEDPYIILNTEDKITTYLKGIASLFFIITSVLMVVATTFVTWLAIIRRKGKEESNVLKELNSNRKLIWNLSKNDFKTKFAGSYFGIFWAFVQPIVTILIYVFVFQVGFKAAPEGDYPYVLWLIAGIIPWFFFVEALINATNCLIEYTYLVKKVVFKISVLPFVKIISSLFVHIFFILFAIFIFFVNGKVPTLAIFQVLYYCICAIALVLALSYITTSIVPFFKDFSQIVSILTQIGMWMLPIMWNKNMLAAEFQWILKINPMYYVVDGYRDSFIYGTYFWEKPSQTIYFWFVVIILFLIGKTIFNKLKVHFSDVL